MEKCYECKKSLDSYYQIYYVDRNGKLTDESELEAFLTLNPHERGKLTLKKVFICGLCNYFSIGNKNNDHT